MNNIREAIGKVQLYTIDNVLAWPTEQAIWMKLLSIINLKDSTFK